MADTDLTPPLPVTMNALRGLELRKRYHRGVRTTAELAKGKPVSKSTLKAMKKFWTGRVAQGFEKRDAFDGGPTTAQVQWLLMGGQAGKEWLEKMEVPDEDTKSIDVTIAKVDEALGIVFGYAIVCKDGEEDFFDSQGDHIPEAAMLEATADYMSGHRIAKDMHMGGTVGQVVYGFPMTGDIAKALGIEVQKTGFIVGMKPDGPELLEKYAKGSYTGFSIGGKRISQENVDG